MGVSDVFAHVLEQIDSVTARGERFACGRRNRALGDERAIGGPELHAPDEPTGRPDRARGVHPQFERPHDRHRVDLRLASAAHRSGHRCELPFALDDDGEKRMRRAFPPCECVRMVGVEHERGAAVVEHDAGSGVEDARTEPGVQALDQRDREAPMVRGDERDGVVRERWCGFAQLWLAYLVDDAGEVAFVEERPDGNAGEPRIGVVSVAVDRRDAEHLRDRSGVRTEWIRIDLQSLDCGEDLQQNEPLRVRRRDVHVEVAVAELERRVELGLVRCEIVDRHRSAERREMVGDGRTDLAAVQGVGTSINERFERSRERRLDEDGTFAEHRRVSCVHVTQAGVGEDLLSV